MKAVTHSKHTVYTKCKHIQGDKEKQAVTTVKPKLFMSTGQGRGQEFQPHVVTIITPQDTSGFGGNLDLTELKYASL